MATFDFEDLLANVGSILTANLNTKIAAIEVEKDAAGQTLTPAQDQVASDAYFVQAWTDKILNRTPAVFYGIEGARPTSIGPVTAQEIRVFITMFVLDNGQTNDCYLRTLRYIRALKEVFEEAYDSIASTGRIKIETMAPVSFKLEADSSEEYKAGGVSITVTLA